MRPFRTQSPLTFRRMAAVLALLAALAAEAAAQEIPPGPGEPQDRGIETQIDGKKKRKREKKEQIVLDKARSRKGMPQDVESLFAKAQEQLAKKNWVQAREALLVLEDNPDALSIQAEVKLALADSYYGEGDILSLVEGTTRYRNFLTYYPNHPKAPYAQFQVGNCYWEQRAKADRDQSQTRNALFEYQKLLEMFPGSEHAEEAQAKILQCRDVLAAHDISVSRYYFVRKDWDAAASRLQAVLSDYPEYGQKNTAYYMLAQSFYKMGSQAEGDVYQKLWQESGGRGKNFEVPKTGARRVSEEQKRQEKAKRQEEKRMLEEEKKAEAKRKKESGGKP